MPDNGPLPIMPPAAVAAEQTILRALLSDQWCSQLQKRAGYTGESPRLASEDANRLATMLWALVVIAGMTPSEAISRLTDPALFELAQAIRLADEETPLTAEAIEDAVRELETYLRHRKNEQIRATLGDATEGNSANSDELLRQWTENARRLKGGSGKDPESDQPSL